MLLRLSPLLSILCIALLLCSFTVPARASEELISVKMNDAGIRDIVQWIGEKTRRQLVIDPRVSGRMTVFAEDPMTVSEAWDLVIAALNVYGYSAVETDGITRILPVSQVGRQAREIVADFQQLRGGRQVVYVLSPKVLSAGELAKILRPLVPSAGMVRQLEETNKLVVADQADTVRSLVELARMLDQRGRADIDVIGLKHASARDMAGIVGSLFNNGRRRSSLQVSADARSNALLLSGTQADRRAAKTIIAQLDTQLTGVNQTEVIFLNYLDAAEVLPALRSAGNEVRKRSPLSIEVSSDLGIEVVPSANALILTAEPDLMARVKAVIAELDRPRRQVHVEAMIVEVSEGFLQQLGVEWNTSLTARDSAEAVSSFGLRDNIGSETLDDWISEGLSIGVFRNGGMRALLRAARNDVNTNILSTPSLTTLDNEPAEILVGSNIPVITGQSTDGTSSTNPFTTIERRDIGVTLKLTPRVNNDRAVTLLIEQVVETLAQSTANAADLITDRRAITTNVLVEDQSVIVLGGLTSTEQRQRVEQVPVLGSMPLVGGLFRNTTDEWVKRNLMVFIQPRILDAQGEPTFSAAQAAALERAQERTTALRTETTATIPEPEPTTARLVRENAPPPAAAPDTDKDDSPSPPLPDGVQEEKLGLVEAPRARRTSLAAPKAPESKAKLIASLPPPKRIEAPPVTEDDVQIREKPKPVARRPHPLDRPKLPAEAPAYDWERVETGRGDEYVYVPPGTTETASAVSATQALTADDAEKITANTADAVPAPKLRSPAPEEPTVISRPAVAQVTQPAKPRTDVAPQQATVRPAPGQRPGREPDIPPGDYTDYRWP